MKKRKKVSSVKKSKEAEAVLKVREGSLIKITNRELRDLLNYGRTSEGTDINPYNRIMSSYDISPRVMNKCQHLTGKVQVAVENLETCRTKLIEGFCKKDKKGEPIKIPDENEVMRRTVKHFAELAENAGDLNLDDLFSLKSKEESKKRIMDDLPPHFYRYEFDDEEKEKFEKALKELLDQEVEFDELKKIVVIDGDLPERFLNAYERHLLSFLFEFDDLE